MRNQKRKRQEIGVMLQTKSDPDMELASWRKRETTKGKDGEDKWLRGAESSEGAKGMGGEPRTEEKRGPREVGQTIRIYGPPSYLLAGIRVMA